MTVASSLDATPSSLTSSPPQRVLLVGIGYVGQHLARELTSTGHEVFGLCRSDRPLPERVHPLRGDVTTRAGFEAIPRDVDQIVYAVAPAERSESAYELAYYRGLQNLRELLPTARVLLVSSTAVYGENTATLIDETTPASPLDTASHQLRRAEELLDLDAAHVVLRASGIYGPGRTRLLTQLAQGELPESERNLITNRIHRNDLARCLAFFIERPRQGGLFIASDEEPATLGELSDWVREQEIPRTWLETTPPRRRQVTPRKSRALSSAKLRAAGFSFHYPSFRQGYAELLRATLAEG